jgi:NAD(P)-dependent dehydrogenase (short-subunit alcohol dehydrogenase family)
MDTGTLDLTGQAAFVTGGGAGIGRAVAICLAAHGADVAVLDIVPDRAAETVARIEEFGRQGLALPANAMEAEQVAKAVETAAERFGRLDVLVNNAGGVTRRQFTDLTEKNWRRHIDLNLISALAATSAATPIMIAGGRGGSIINVTSIEGSRAAPGFAVDAACKAGINNLTRTLAVELGSHGIRVNAIAPDFTATPGLAGNFVGPVAETPELSEAQQDIMRRRVPLGRAGIDAECGHLAVFLASRMAAYITGVVIPIDGGTYGSSGWIRSSATGNWVLPPEA